MPDLFLYLVLVLGHTYGQPTDNPLLTDAQILERLPNHQSGTHVNNAGSTGRNFHGTSFEPGSPRRQTANIPSAKGQITDIYGKAPPPFTETHIDMPGEHCNEGTDPVVHIGGVHEKCQTTTTTNVQDHHLISSNNVGSINNQRETSNVIPEKGIFDASSVHFSPGTQRTVTGNFIDLSLNDNMVFNNIPRNPYNNVNTPINSQRVTADGTHIDMPGQHGNPTDGQPVVHRVEQGGTTTGMSNGHGANELQGQHVDNAQVDSTITHIDLPGRHGNEGTTPLLHRSNPPHPSTGVRRKRVDQHVVHVQKTGNLGRTHIDMPGEHGNPRNGQPVVHRVEVGETSTRTSHGHGANQLRHHRTGNVQRDLTKTHIDLPGQHGNIATSPVLHRIGPVHHSTETSTGLADQQGQVNENIQVDSKRHHQDRSVQHGNTAHVPVDNTPNNVARHVNPGVVHRQRPAKQQFISQHVRSQQVNPQPEPSQQVYLQHVRSQQANSQPEPSQPVHSQHVPSQQVHSQPEPSQQVHSQHLPSQQVHSQPKPSQPVHSQHLPSQQVNSQHVQNQRIRIGPPGVLRVQVPSWPSAQHLTNIQQQTRTYPVPPAQTATTGVFWNNRVGIPHLNPNTVRLSRNHRLPMDVVPLAEQAPPTISYFQPQPERSLGAIPNFLPQPEGSVGSIPNFQPQPERSLGGMLGIPTAEILNRPLPREPFPEGPFNLGPREPFPEGPFNLGPIHPGVVETYGGERRGRRGGYRGSRRRGGWRGRHGPRGRHGRRRRRRDRLQGLIEGVAGAIQQSVAGGPNNMMNMVASMLNR